MSKMGQQGPTLNQCEKKKIDYAVKILSNRNTKRELAMQVIEVMNAKNEMEVKHELTIEALQKIQKKNIEEIQEINTKIIGDLMKKNKENNERIFFLNEKLRDREIDGEMKGMKL